MDSTTLRSPISSLDPATPICVEDDEPVKQAIETMQKHRIGCVCVLGDGELKGIVTERDILTKVVGAGLDAQQIKVADVMTPSPEYLYPDDEIAFALNRMHLGGFRHVPLVNLEGHATGVISVKDIVGYLIKSLDD